MSQTNEDRDAQTCVRCKTYHPDRDTANFWYPSDKSRDPDGLICAECNAQYTTIELARYVLATQTAVVAIPLKVPKGAWSAFQTKPFSESPSDEGILLDMQSANVIVTVYNHLTRQSSRDNLLSLSLPTAVGTCWKLVANARHARN